MEVAGSAVGIASLGIQVCGTLLTYYNAWKDYNSDVGSVYDSTDSLGRTLALLHTSLEHDDLDKEKKERVQRCLKSCEKSLIKLSEKAQKLRKYGQPDDFKKKAWAELQRAWYPFRASSLAKLREIVTDVQEQLKLAVQVLQLDISTTSQQILKSAAADTSRIADRTKVIVTSVDHISAQNQRILDLQQSDQFTEIKVWLSAPDPWTNHAAARQQHEPHTGSWLLQSDQYQRWKAGGIHPLWLYGKAGCGKSVLCSSAIEDIRLYCERNEDAMYAVFYFTFSDNQKQSYESLLRSLVAQVGWKEPGLSMLIQACKKRNQSFLEVDEMEKILISCGRSHRGLFLLLDALDECPECNDVRQNVLDGLERLGPEAPNIRILVTSREVYDVGESMQALRADSVCIATQLMDGDIRRYVLSQLARDRRLRKFPTSTKDLIKETILRKADGMFRWVYCQLQELKELKSTRPSHVREALLNLPETLDETYERMLTKIGKTSRQDALVLLRWLTYAQSPPALGELAEAQVINLEGGGSVDVDDRGGLEDLLTILSGLVMLEEIKEPEFDPMDPFCSDGDPEVTKKKVTDHPRRVEIKTTVRFAHFSVKEYLESERIQQSDANMYHMESAREHRFLAQSCLIYLLQYSCNSENSTSIQEDCTNLPLLEYAARSWFHHASLQQIGEVSREASLLSSIDARRDWLSIFRPDDIWYSDNGLSSIGSGSGIYYASFLGLSEVVKELLRAGADVNAQEGCYGNALQAASREGYEEVVCILLNADADVNAQEGFYGNALQAASVKGYAKVVQMLIGHGADVNAQAGHHYGTALQGASHRGHKEVLEILLDAGADVNGQGGQYGNALQAASLKGNKKVVEILLNAGADPNAQGGYWGNALRAASAFGHGDIVDILLNAGADINALTAEGHSALSTASWKGHQKVVAMLLERGASYPSPEESCTTSSGSEEDLGETQAWPALDV